MGRYTCPPYRVDTMWGGSVGMVGGERKCCCCGQSSILSRERNPDCQNLN